MDKLELYNAVKLIRECCDLSSCNKCHFNNQRTNECILMEDSQWIPAQWKLKELENNLEV